MRACLPGAFLASHTLQFADSVDQATVILGLQKEVRRDEQCCSEFQGYVP